MKISPLWLVTLLPSVPLISIYLAFKSVLDSKKFEMRMLLMRGASLTTYLSAYGSRQQEETPDLADKEALDAFVLKIVNKIFWLHYSDWEYFYAIFFNVLVVSALTALALCAANIPLGLPVVLTTHLSRNAVVDNILAGGIGALLWSIYEFAERYRSGDLAPDSIFSMGARMLIVSAVGAFLGAVLTERLAWPVAFGVGVLPMASVRAFLLSRTAKALKLPNKQISIEDTNFDSLQGWNEDVSEKLRRAGITSVQQLACTNPFQIFLRSNLDWRVILDLCDQALLVVYIGARIDGLRILGYRSAGELAGIDWYKDDPESFCDFTREDAIKEIGLALEMEMLQVRMLVRGLSEDITVSLIATLWSDDTPGEHNEDEDEDEGEESAESAASPLEPTVEV